jgi:hypothetical protein
MTVVIITSKQEDATGRSHESADFFLLLYIISASFRGRRRVSELLVGRNECAKLITETCGGKKIGGFSALLALRTGWSSPDFGAAAARPPAVARRLCNGSAFSVGG